MAQVSSRSPPGRRAGSRLPAAAGGVGSARLDSRVGPAATTSVYGSVVVSRATRLSAPLPSGPSTRRRPPSRTPQAPSLPLSSTGSSLSGGRSSHSGRGRRGAAEGREWAGDGEPGRTNVGPRRFTFRGRPLLKRHRPLPHPLWRRGDVEGTGGPCDCPQTRGKRWTPLDL